MAGRGRGATLPAWMTNGGGEAAATNGHTAPISSNSQSSAGQFDDYKTQPPARYPEPSFAPPVSHAPAHYSVGSVPPPVDYQRNDQRQGGYNDSRGRDEGRSGGRDRPRSRSPSKYVCFLLLYLMFRL